MIPPALLPLTASIEPDAPPIPWREWLTRTRPSYRWYRHCEALASVLQDVASGKRRRVMIFLPPRHSKSETVSRLFSAYYLACHPDRWVGLNSYAAGLAFTLSRAARENFINSGGQVRSDAAAVAHWETAAGGGFWAAGVGGPITGKGFHLGIIDDPLKNAEEANSEIVREKHKDWYSSTFYTRAEPDASIIVIQTRWHEDDLSGWLLSQEAEDEPEKWHVVNLPAIAESAVTLPPTCTLEPDWRRKGAALCPERYPLERLRAIQARIGAYYWLALYQQQPTPKEGEFFKVAAMPIVGAAPAGQRQVRAWDVAATAGDGDYSSGILMSGDGAGRYWVRDVQRGQWSPDDADAIIKQTAALDGLPVEIHLAQDPGSAGKRDAATLIRMLSGYIVKAEPITGSKEARARAFASQVNAGNVSLVSGPWNRAFIDELRAFPRGRNDDQVDAAADAFNELAGPGWEFS